MTRIQRDDEGVTLRPHQLPSWTNLDDIERDKARTDALAALTRITNILDHKAELDNDHGHCISVNEEVLEAQQFIRDNFGALGNGTDDDFATDYPALALKPEWAELILHDLEALNRYPYISDKLTEIAISLSLCPVHFLDWAICFDDDDEECSQVRAIYPYSHDT